jgi:hypothetical protein
VERRRDERDFYKDIIRRAKAMRDRAADQLRGARSTAKDERGETDMAATPRKRPRRK